ncbi:MAG: hypothetical protein ACYTG0_01890 [Planctomycetota bacterium]|jgi:hypothetical protein
MNPTPLRVFHGPLADSHKADAEVPPSRQTVTVPLGEIVALLADAVQSKRTWLRDFDDDAVTISMDLYEVILAYQHYRRPSA